MRYKRHELKPSSSRITLGLIGLALLLAGGAGAVTLTVDDSGGANFTGIQDAIDNASEGDTILVYRGAYYENVNVSKRLVLRGVDNGGGKPVVDAGGRGSAIILSAGNSTLEGFTAINSPPGYLCSFPIPDFCGGVRLTSNNNLIKNNSASNNSYGIYLSSSSNNTLYGNDASNNTYGIFLLSSSNNTLYGNDASNNTYGAYGNGIYLLGSSNNTLNGNNASNNTYGISLSSSSNNILTINIMIKNKYNFDLVGNFDNQIETNNLVDGKPVYFIKDAVDAVYNSSTNAGTFYCINCINVTIKDINVSSNSRGILFQNTTYSKIQNVNASNNDKGIFLFSSSNNTLNGNNASNNTYGIDLILSSNNTLSGNSVNSNNYEGIRLDYSSNNTLNGNNASNNTYGIDLILSSNNTLSGNNASNNRNGIRLGFYSINKIYNNIFNNTNNIYLYEVGTTSNTWNTTRTPGTNIIGGSYLGGNFWAYPNGTGFSQTCTDSDNDGLCDSPYTLNSSNIDYLPLASPAPAPVLSPLVAPFDTSGDGSIQRNEAVACVVRFFSGDALVPRTTAVAVVVAFFSPQV